MKMKKGFGTTSGIRTLCRGGRLREGIGRGGATGINQYLLGSTNQQVGAWLHGQEFRKFSTRLV